MSTTHYPCPFLILHRRGKHPPASYRVWHVGLEQHLIVLDSTAVSGGAEPEVACIDTRTWVIGAMKVADLRLDHMQPGVASEIARFLQVSLLGTETSHIPGAHLFGGQLIVTAFGVPRLIFTKAESDLPDSGVRAFSPGLRLSSTSLALATAAADFLDRKLKVYRD